MLVGGIDVETTGLEVSTNEITEVGLVIWDTELKAPVWMFSAMRKELKTAITEEITKLTGLTDDLIQDWGESDAYIQEHITKFSNAVNCYMAHNAGFDRAFMLKHYETAKKPWVCSASHVAYPEKVGASRSLNVLAYEHNFINPWRHRAVTDVLTMLKVATNYNIHAAVEKSQEKVAVLHADFRWGCAGFERIKEEVKERRFYWKPNTKRWIKELPLSEAEAYIGACPPEMGVRQLSVLEPLHSYEDSF